MSSLATWSALKDIWQQRETLGDGSKNRQMSAFLPAALEIQSTPPHPLAKWSARSLMVLFALVGLWACFGHVNIVAMAEGKIIPSSRVKQIQPLDKGVVKKIHVREGQLVKRGDALIELDQTITDADQQRIGNNHYLAHLHLARLEALKRLLEQHDKTFEAIEVKAQYEAPKDANPHDTSLQQQLLQQQWQQYVANKGALISSLQARRAEKESGQEIITKLENTLPIITQRANSLKALLDKQMVSETQYLELEQLRIESYHDLAAQRAAQKQLEASINENQRQLEGLLAQQRGDNLVQLAEKEREISALSEELTKAQDMHAKQILYAPVNGVVQELVVATIGGVVMEAQQLMLIVPHENQLEVQAMLPNKDIGFVEEGMNAEIKVHTFPFTKYGVIDAEVLTISDDAIADENLGLVYAVNLRMNNDTINVNGKAVKLMPGMSVTAEMKTGERRLIEFFLAPLLRYKQESIRER